IDYFQMKKNRGNQKDKLTREHRLYREGKNLFEPYNKVKQFLSLDTINKYNEILAKLPDEVDPIIQVYSGYMMIMITEAPHYNLYKWTSRNYVQKGILYKMT